MILSQFFYKVKSGKASFLPPFVEFAHNLHEKIYTVHKNELKFKKTLDKCIRR